MKVLDRYIARAVISGAIISLLVFTALFIFIDFVSELEHVGQHQYGVTQALWYVLLSAPQRLYELSPPAILLGGLISLGAMSVNFELIAMRAAGITLVRFIRSVLQAGLILVIAIVILGEFVVPYTTPEANVMRAAALKKNVLAGGKNGFWAKNGNRYIKVEQVLPNRQLNNVSIYELSDDRKLIRITTAEQANFQDGVWQLINVEHSDLSQEQVRISSSHTETWQELLEPDLFDVLHLKPVNMSARHLYLYSAYMEKNELDASQYQLAFWIKVFTPLTCLAMLLIAMPLVLSATPRSGGTGQRIILGLLIGIGFFVFNRAVNHLGIVYGLMPALSAVLPLVVVVMTSIVLLRRIR